MTDNDDLRERVAKAIWHEYARSASTPFPERAAQAALSATPIEALQQRVERLEAELAGIAKMAEYRIEDGIEMGAPVWRIALEDIASDARAALGGDGG